MTTIYRPERVSMTRDHATMCWGPFCFVIWRGHPSLEAIAQVRENARFLLRRFPSNVALIALAEPEAPLAEGPIRKVLAAANDEFAASGVAAICAVLPMRGFRGACFRGMIAALNQMARKRYPMQVFANSREAVSWSRGHLTVTVEQGACVSTIESFRQEYHEAWEALDAPSSGSLEQPRQPAKL